MYSAQAHAMDVYRNVGVETAVHDAKPHALVLLLFEGARVAVSNARAQMQLKEPAAKGAAIGKAIEIIDCGLNASLNLEQGGRIAEQLRSLYEYMIERLTLANLHNEPGYLEEVGKLLAELEGAWREIGPPVAAADPAPALGGRASVSYGKA